MKRIFRKIKHIYSKIKPFPHIIKYKPKGITKISYFSAFSYGNAGDTLLPIVLKDLFNYSIGVKKWIDIHVHKPVNQKILSRTNTSDCMVIGGGGLFLKDTNPNDLSGWQWSCSIENLNKINVPIIMFAVGYNRFRGQEEFDPIFTEHLNAFVTKAAFVGIRNIGSIKRLQEYLESEELKQKLVFQPCMTTLISKLYPSVSDFGKKEDCIAINCAFDREQLRINSNHILESIARVVKKLSKITRIRYYSHMKSDLKILPFFDAQQIPYELIEFNNPTQIIKEYAKPRLVLGMRGHAQMIPFGCKTPILSIVSHDKLQWFLDDISHPEWGVDVINPNFEIELYNKSLDLYQNFETNIQEITLQQEKLWDITNKNLAFIKSKIKK